MSRLERLAEALGLPAPEQVCAAMARLYAEVDAEIARRAAGHALPCRAGCDACCHEAVFLSAPEFFYVAAHLLEQRSAEQLARLVQEMRVLAQRFADELELLELIPAGPERDEVAARVKLSCPLLGEGGRCGVYPARELNARTFGLTWDGARGHAYGCELTQARLVVLPPEVGRSLFDAREARRRLVAAVPNTERVQVYPWWFDRYGEILCG